MAPLLAGRPVLRPAALQERLILAAQGTAVAMDDFIGIVGNAQQGIAPHHPGALQPWRILGAAVQAQEVGHRYGAEGIDRMMLRRNRCSARRVIAIAGKVAAVRIKRVIMVDPGEEIIGGLLGPFQVAGFAGQFVQVQR
jgi:hypothetical protein